MEQPMGWGKARKCGGQKTKLKKKKKKDVRQELFKMLNGTDN